MQRRGGIETVHVDAPQVGPTMNFVPFAHEACATETSRQAVAGSSTDISMRADEAEMGEISEPLEHQGTAEPDMDRGMDVDIVERVVLASGRTSRPVRPTQHRESPMLRLNKVSVEQLGGCSVPTRSKNGEEYESDMRDLVALLDVDDRAAGRAGADKHASGGNF